MRAIGVLKIVVGGVLSIVLVAALREGVQRMPANWKPWGEIELDQAPTWFSRWQISRLDANADLCFAALERSNMEYQKLEDRQLQGGCGVFTRTEVLRSNIPYSSGFEAPCALAAALYWYEARLNSLAKEYMNTQVSRIEHFGTYACRNIYGRTEDRLSAHASARAIDISGFRMADGTRVSVLDDWKAETPASDFLDAAREEACRFFGPVLSPEYNVAHANHFHLELGGSRLCR